MRVRFDERNGVNSRGKSSKLMRAVRKTLILLFPFRTHSSEITITGFELIEINPYVGVLRCVGPHCCVLLLERL
jgi:hypothetical protein